MKLLLQLGWVLMMVALALHEGAAANKPLSATPQTRTLPGCNSTCGKVEIPYPFGTGKSSSPDRRPCFFDERFNVTCENSTLYYGNVPVLDINVLTHQIEVDMIVAWICYGVNDSVLNSWWSSLGINSNFSISSKENKLLTVGTDTYGYVNSVFNGETYSTGCLTISLNNTRNLYDGTCSGIGCCQVDIPPRMRNITVRTRLFPNSSLKWGNCSYSFVAKDGSYIFSTAHLHSFPYKMLPLVVDWTVGDENCEASMSRDDYACMNNSYCDHTDTDYGYRCRCKHGYEGNPYHPDGCIE